MDDMELIHLLRRAAVKARRCGGEGRDPERPAPPEGEGFGPGCGRGGHGPWGEDFGHGPHGHGGGCRGHGPGEGMCHHHRPHRERDRVLSLLDDTEGISQQKLALILDIRPQSLSELLLKLERDGLLTREKNPADRRETLVSLTPEGKERAAEFEAERRRFGEAFFAPLTDEERETLGELLGKLLAGPDEE